MMAAAVDELKAMPRSPGCPFVAPNPKSRKPYTSVFGAWDTARRAAGLFAISAGCSARCGRVEKLPQATPIEAAGK